MNWEAVGAVAELMGAIGVIASLVYLARQIQSSSDNVAQNTKALISNRDVSSNEFALAVYGPQIENEDVASLMLRGLSEPGDLTDAERYRHNLVLLSMFESHQTFFIQQGSGAVSTELWEYYSRNFDGLCRSRGVQEWWKERRAMFHPPFAAYIDQKIPTDA